MKRKTYFKFFYRFSRLVLPLARIAAIFTIFLFPKLTNAQVAGDYGMFQTGTWSVAANWKIYNGVSWASSPVAAAYPGNPTINVFILPGVTCTLTISSTPCRNLTINATGKLFTNNNPSNVYVNVYGDILCDGTIGNGITFDGISLNIEGPSCIFTGIGVVDCSRIRKNLNTNPTSNLVFDINVNLRFASGSQTQIYNNAPGTVFNITINAGKTLSLPAVGGFVGHVSMDGLSGNGFGEMGGSYTINGTLSISGTIYLLTDNATTPCTVNIGSTGIVQAANVIANNSTAATHSLNMATGALFQITGTPFTNPFQLINNNYNLALGSTIEYSAPGVQAVDSNLTYANLKISGAGNKTAAGPIDAIGNITITNAAGAAVFVPYAPSALVRLGGDWITYGTAGFSETNSRVTFNGSINQTISCSNAAGEDFASMTVNKSGGKVYLSSAPATIVKIITQLDLTLGNIVTSSVTSATNYFIRIQNAATIVNVSDNSFVEGACARELIGGSPVNFTYPIGKIAKYRPEAIQGTPTSNTLMLGEYFKIDPNTVGPVTQLDPTLDHVSRCEYWRLRNIGAIVPQTFFVTLSWDTYSACNNGVTLLPDLRVASWNSPAPNIWNNMGNSGTTGNISAGTVKASVLSSFLSSAAAVGGTPFTLSSVSIENPLPIKLISFNAKPVKDRVELNWTTASETNNDFFSIERSPDGISFDVINRKEGAGNSTELKFYEDVDTDPLTGVSYYRLKQTDFDGNYSYSDIISVAFKSSGELAVFAYPLPASDYLNVRCSGRGENYLIKIIAPDGRLLKLIEAGTETQIDLGDLNPGVYFLAVSEGENTKTTRIIKK